MTTEVMAPPRSSFIGGSDIPAILGLSPYKTPLDVYLEKRGLWEDEAAGEAARWGTIMEPILAREYADRYGVPVLRRENGRVILLNAGDFPEAEGEHLLATLTHPVYPWARGHLDGVGIAESGVPRHVCEFKTADSRLGHLWGDEGTDQVPEPYLVQCQWYMMLAELELSELAVLLGGNRFQRYIIRRDQDLIDLMLEQAAEFWHRVETRNAPDPEPGERGKQSLAHLYPRGHFGKELDATPDMLEMAAELHAAREAADTIEHAKMTLENNIKSILGDAVRLNLGPRSYISWKNNKDSIEIDWEAAFRDLARTLEEESPAICPEVIEGTIALHTTTKPGPRVFRCQGLDKLFAKGKP